MGQYDRLYANIIYRKKDLLMELIETAELMKSADYKERFKAEYYQTDIRIRKLETFLKRYRANELDFTPDCSTLLLQTQLDVMKAYRGILTRRAEIENVDISYKE